MKSENINHAFLDGVLDGSHRDVYYHLGMVSSDPTLDAIRDVSAVIMAGPGGRINQFADRWSQLCGGSQIVAFPTEDRFVTRYTGEVLFASHGMGMPSAAIALQELMRLVFFLKGGDLDAMAQVRWCRVGTSGGIGLPVGTVVVSTAGLMVDLSPYRLLRGGAGEYWFDGSFPAATCDDIIVANDHTDVNIVTGKTVAGNDFFLEQFRLDGAICLETPTSKLDWLRWLHSNGVRNIEMEGAMFAGYLNHWGFPNFGMICCTVVDRLAGDQMTASSAQLKKISADAGSAAFNYLQATMGDR